MSIKELLKKRRVRFLCACLVGFCVHYGLVNALTTLTGWWYLPIALICLIVGYTVTFFLQKHWTFKSNGSSRNGQISGYIKVSLVYYAANVVALLLLVDISNVPYMLAQAEISLMLTLSSYSTEKDYVFA